MLKFLKSTWQKAVLHGYRDRAVFYTSLSRVISVGLGPFVVLAVGSYLNPEQQGVYYVFGSLLQLRGLIDLGFSQSSQQLLANRFSDLSLTPDKGVQGDVETQSAYLNLAKFTCGMYLVLGLITALGVGFAGDLFLSHHLAHHHDLSWRGAWWVMISCVGINLSTMGIVVVADGANQVALTNQWRFWSEVIAVAAFLLVLAAGGGLWASAAMAIARIWIAIPILKKLGRALIRQICEADSNAVSFRRNILPLQTRNTVVWGLGFLCYYAYNPVALKFLGPAEAGIVGMSLQMANMTSGLALVWYNTKLPRLGNFAGAGNLQAANELHLTGARFSMLLWIVLGCGVWVTAYIVKSHFSAFGVRFASLGSLALFLLGSGAYVWCHVRASYIRAFCVELFAPLAVVQGFTTLAILCYSLPRWGIGAAASSYLLVMLIGAIWIEIGYRSFTRRGEVPSEAT